MKRACVSLLSVAMLGSCSIGPALAETSEELETMWECPQADGTPLYTNKEQSGCKAMTLKPLSVVPDLGTSHRTMRDIRRHLDSRPSQDGPSQTPDPTVPDCVKDCSFPAGKSLLDVFGNLGVISTEGHTRESASALV